VDKLVRIGVVGDYNPAFPGHVAIKTSLEHAAESLSISVSCEWVPTPAITRDNAADTVGRCDAIWTAPGSPYRSKNGMFAAIEFARKRDWPYVGT
jgi:CTP synthase (UTP-ammonia lyase)